MLKLKVVALLLVLVLVTTVLTSYASAENNTVRNVNGIRIANDEAEFIEIASIPIGKGRGEARYYIDDIVALGPQDFLVRDDGSICILNTIGEKIIIVNRDDMQEVDISKTSGITFGQLFDYYDGKYYVLDLISETIDIFSEDIENNFRLNNISIILPNEVTADEITDLYVDFEGIRITTDICDYVISHDDESVFRSIDSLTTGVSHPSERGSEKTREISIGDRRWSIVEGENELLGTLCDDNNGNIYADVHDFVPDTPFSISERTIRVYNENGDLFGVARVDYQNWAAYPLKDIKITKDGSIYLMSCTKDAIIIEEIILGQRYTSKMQELMVKAATLEGEYGLNNDIAKQDSGGFRIITLSRGQVNGNASSYRYKSWRSTSANRTKPSGYTSVVTIPTYVANSGNSDDLTSVPYCWGGFDSISQFDTKRGNGNTTGNVSSANGVIVPGTTGVDCSGFLSRVYGLSTKKNAAGFVGWERGVNSITAMGQSDFFATSSHVRLFNSLSSNQTSVNITESTTGSFGYVVTRGISTTEVSGNNTYMGSPWN